MGAYINPPNMSKEQWLNGNATQITESQARKHKDFKNILLVVLVDNLWFTSAGIAFNELERDAFMNGLDPRPKRYYLAKKSDLELVSNISLYMEKDEEPVKWQKSTESKR